MSNLRLSTLIFISIGCFSCISTGPRVCFDAKMENLYSTLSPYDGKDICVSGELLIGTHSRFFETRYSNIALPYGGDITLTLTYDEASALNLTTGDIFEAVGTLEIKQLRDDCIKDECFIYRIVMR